MPAENVDRLMLLTLDECRTLLRCSRSTVWRLMRRGDLRPVRLTDGGPPRFLYDDVRALIQSRIMTAGP